jgi:hypothetical protein
MVVAHKLLVCHQQQQGAPCLLSPSLYSSIIILYSVYDRSTAMVQGLIMLYTLFSSSIYFQFLKSFQSLVVEQE